MQSHDSPSEGQRLGTCLRQENPGGKDFEVGLAFSLPQQSVRLSSVHL